MVQNNNKKMIYSHKFFWVRDLGTAYLGGSGSGSCVRLHSKYQPGCNYLDVMH